MTNEQIRELLMILSRFEGFLWGSKINDEYINTQLDIAIEILRGETDE